jgi:hypothetical protein
MIKDELRLVTEADVLSDPTAVIGDLYFDPIYGQSEVIAGSDALAQRLAIKLTFVKGSYKFNTRYGIDYFNDILTENPNFILLNGIFVNAITETPGVAKIADPGLEFSFDRSTRTFSLDSGNVICDNGETAIFGGGTL